jgi:opacity protein-like surface antigen
MKRSMILMTLLIIPWLMIAPALAQTQTQTAAPESVAAPDKTPATATGKQTTAEQNEILQKLQDLQKQVDTMKEQGRTREKLTITAEEKAAAEKSVLTAVGREYTLMQKGKIELDYSLRYEYIASSEIVDATKIEPRSNHTVRNAIGIQYGLLNNVTVNTNIPYVYVYDKSGSASAIDSHDMGDVTLGLDYQPFKSSGEWPTTTISMSAILPTGSSPYKINRDTDLPTGGGLYGVSVGLNMSKSIDPAMAFGGISCVYRLKRHDLSQYMDGIGTLDSVEPGMSYNAAIGLAYAISYALSMNVQFQYGYNMSTEYAFTSGAETSSASYSNASVIIGTGWRISPKTTLSFSVGIGLTSNDPDFYFYFRLPFSI